MTTLTKPVAPSDVFAYIGPQLIYAVESKEITNGTADDWDLPPGYPMDDNVPELVAGIADVDGVLYDRAIVKAGETVKAAVVVRGPVVVNGDALPAADYAGTPFVLADLITQLLDIPQLIVRREPEIQAAQTS